MQLLAAFALGAEPRARPLLFDLLRSDDVALIGQAIYGLGLHREESALPIIQQVIEARPDEAQMLAEVLVYFESAAADALAMRYLGEDSRRCYEQQRAELQKR
jgi:hypothetical protein